MTHPDYSPCANCSCVESQRDTIQTLRHQRQALMEALGNTLGCLRDLMPPDAPQDVRVTMHRTLQLLGRIRAATIEDR